MLIGFVQGYEELKWGISKLNPLCNGPLRAVACKMCLFSFNFVKPCMLYGMIGVPCLYNFALRKFDFRGLWSVTPKNRGWSNITQRQIGSLAVGTYHERGSAPRMLYATTVFCLLLAIYHIILILFPMFCTFFFI